MPEAIPVLSIARPVLNVTPEHMEAVSESLLREVDGTPAEHEGARETIESLLSPANKLHASIISNLEFKFLQRDLGDNRLDEEEVRELHDSLDEELMAFADTRDVHTLPLQIHRRGDGPNYVLTAGDSIGMVRERVFAKRVIADFVECDLPPNVWHRQDGRATQVWLACAENKTEAAMLTHLRPVLERQVSSPVEGTLSFPGAITLGGANIQLAHRPIEPRVKG